MHDDTYACRLVEFSGTTRGPVDYAKKIELAINEMCDGNRWALVSTVMLDSVKLLLTFQRVSHA